MEEHINSYKLEQNNKEYIFSTSIVGNKMRMSCQNSNGKKFYRDFTVEQLKQIDDIFNFIKTPHHASEYIDKALRKEKVGVTEDNGKIKISFYITTKGMTHLIEIPLGDPSSFNNANEHQFLQTENLQNYGQVNSPNNEVEAILKASFGEPNPEDQELNKYFENIDIQNAQTFESNINQYMPNENVNQNNFDINQLMGNANKNANININQRPNTYMQGVDTIPIIGPVDDSVNKYMTTVNIVQNSPIMNNPQYGHRFETPINNNNQVSSFPFIDIKELKPTITPSTPAMHNQPQLAFNQNPNVISTPIMSSPRQRTEENDNIDEQIKQLLKEQNINPDLDNQIEMQAEVKKLNSSLKPLTTTKVLPVQTTTKILPPIGVSSLKGVNLNQFVNFNSQNQTSANYQNVQVYQTGVQSQNEFVQPLMNSPIQSSVVVTPQKQVKTNINKKVNSNNNNPININKNVNNINNIENAEVKILRQSYKDEINVLKQENAALKKQLAEIKQMKDALGEETMALRNKLAEIEPLKKKMAEMEVLRGQLTELNTLRAQVAEYNAVKAQLKEMGNLKSQIEQMNSLKAQLAELKEFKKNAEAKIQELEKLNNKYEEEHKTQLKQNKSDKKEEREMENEEDEEDSQNITVKGDIIHDVSELEMLTKKINKDNKKLTLNLLYKATADSDKAAAFHAKCDEAKSSIVLVETDKGKRFGGYTTKSWSGDCTDKKDEDAFVFSFDKMETYDNIPGEDAIGCYPKFGPIFLGCQIRIYDNAFTKGGTTFERSLNFDTKEDFELTGGDRVFIVKEIEVYEVVIED